MKKSKIFLSEKGAAEIIEATIIFPIVFVCVIFLFFFGLTYVQKAHLQSTADRLADYIGNCIMYPGYEYLIDPFYGEPYYGNASKPDDTERINKAMGEKEPYRYIFGFFGLSGDDEDILKKATNEMTKDYLNNVSFLKPSNNDPISIDESKYSECFQANGYLCAVAADMSSVTVVIAENYRLTGLIKMLGINNTDMIISAKATYTISDNVETVRIADFAFEVGEKILDGVGIDTEKIKSVIKKLTGN